jgi:hypothetical protein
VTRIVIEPASIELGLNRDAYDGLVSDLEEGGFDAELRPRTEERWGLPEVPQEFVVASLWLGEHIAGQAFDAIVQMLLSRMWRSRRKLRGQRPPVVLIYGPDGEVLRKVEIPERDD